MGKYFVYIKAYKCEVFRPIILEKSFNTEENGMRKKTTDRSVAGLHCMYVLFNALWQWKGYPRPKTFLLTLPPGHGTCHPWECHLFMCHFNSPGNTAAATSRPKGPSSYHTHYHSCPTRYSLTSEYIELPANSRR